MIKVSDYIANYLAEYGIEHVFMLTGGGAMHLNDSLGKHEKLITIFNHHEQACAMAAESYARLTNKVGVINVTTGPGGLNALNGIFGAWTDSIPMLVLSGQVRYDTTVEGVGLPLRQMGDQEYAIVQSVLPMTKYAVMVTDPIQIKYHLQKALYLATAGRTGPVWLDIPLNIQSTIIDENTLPSYHFPTHEIPEAPVVCAEIVQQVLEKIYYAKRPVIIAGTGVRLSGAYSKFMELVSLLKVPVVTAFNAHDLLPDTHPYYAGRPGTVGDRAGNFAVQNADLILVLGCRLSIRQIGYNWKSFARNAYKIMVDIDATELKKPTISIHLPIHANLADFLKIMILQSKNKQIQAKVDWLEWCQLRRKKYPVVLDEYWARETEVNPYCFIEVLSNQLSENQIIVTGNATACIAAFQAFKIKPNQRLYSNSGSASMGYDLPAAIGACIGSKNQKIVCLAGDGSLQLNIQELATIRYYQLPIKIFVLNNNGYHSIRQTQHNYFSKPNIGVCPESGLFFPNLEKLSSAYELQFHRCENHQEMEQVIANTLLGNNPSLCEIMLTTEQPFSPKMSSFRAKDGRMFSRPLEDLAPFLTRQELAENMIIDLLPEE